MTDWAIPQQAKLKYTQLFNFHDRNRSGFLSGLQCRDILLQSGLPRNILAEIWNLSDLDGDGQLTREEFILAMYLTNNVRTGQTLPTELPADLVPPSYRRTRTISVTSVQSATSATSSVSANNEDQASQKSSDLVTGYSTQGSILSSNSFEDKRRENFEKGRAELEKRRLHIIEQQIGILKEQLAAGKKQVAEAKAKIDSMRSERDTKMGTITALDAQLKELQDRKAFLHHEELSLIALDKDLDLKNPAQAELDQTTTQSKQQSIDQMEEKINEFMKENESKTKELMEVLSRIETCKQEMKSLSEDANKAYENYKEGLAKAEAVRVELVEENKPKSADLDSVWGTNTNFSTPISKPNTFTALSEDPWASVPQNDKISSIDKTTITEEKDVFTSSSQISKLFDSKGDNGFGERPMGSIVQKTARYRAVYAFEARNPDELTINPGDIIIGSDVVTEPGWLSGESNGNSGLFPEAYVELLNNEFDDVVQSNNVDSMEALSFPPDESSQSSRLLKYKVVYAFDARNPDELTINPGDIITGLEGISEPGWLMGEMNGQKGLFPEAYVEKINEEVQDQLENSGKSRQKRADVATVIANYRALGQEQLNLEKGQLVLIRRKMDSGWWEGEVQVKGKKKQFGWFPASYVKLMSNSGSGSMNPTQ